MFYFKSITMLHLWEVVICIIVLIATVFAANGQGTDKFFSLSKLLTNIVFFIVLGYIIEFLADTIFSYYHNYVFRRKFSFIVVVVIKTI